MANFQDIYDFIDRAVKNRNYPSNTALGLKAALRLFEEEINDEERASHDKFKTNIDKIYKNISIKNKNVTASSLSTYKSRVMKVLNDFEKYGIDPTKMANWSTKITVRPKKVTNKVSSQDTPLHDNLLSVSAPSHSNNVHRIELSLRPDTKFVILVPMDIKKSECDILKGMLDSLCIKE